MPPKIHDDFRDVDFWRAIFCPYCGELQLLSAAAAAAHGAREGTNGVGTNSNHNTTTDDNDMIISIE